LVLVKTILAICGYTYMCLVNIETVNFSQNLSKGEKIIEFIVF